MGVLCSAQALGHIVQGFFPSDLTKHAGTPLSGSEKGLS
jgi:hypothetical protein